MFLGHYGLAFATKKVAPKVSLVTLFIAVQLVDIIWPVFLLLGIEEVRIVPGYTEVSPFEFVHYPYTHSLVMGAVWGLVAGILYWLWKKDLRSAVIVGLAVLSHWFLDLFVHVADLPITLNEQVKVGLGGWHSMVFTLGIESLLFFAGIFIYVKNTKPVNAKGKWGLWVTAVFLFLGNLGNMFGPPPQGSLMSLFISFMIAQAIILGLALLTDRNRIAA